MVVTTFFIFVGFGSYPNSKRDRADYSEIRDSIDKAGIILFPKDSIAIYTANLEMLRKYADNILYALAQQVKLYCKECDTFSATLVCHMPPSDADQDILKVLSKLTSDKYDQFRSTYGTLRAVGPRS